MLIEDFRHLPSPFVIGDALGFICPNCQQDTLEIGYSLELPADDSWDEITFQLVACQRCGLRAVAVYQESRRGSLQDEAWQHLGAVIEPAIFQRLTEQISACPAPGERGCGCSAHRAIDPGDYFQPGAVTFGLVLAS